MVEYLYVHQIWLILGVCLILLEVFDSSTIIFLPMGLAGLVMSAWLYFTEIGVVPISTMPTKWYWLLLIWAVISLFWTVVLSLLRRLRPPRSDNGDDVNRY